MLTLLGLTFSQKLYRFLLAMCKLGMPLTILPFVACPLPDRDPLFPSSSTEPKDITCPFHFSLPLDFDKISNESLILFLLSRIHLSDFFYLLGHLRPS